MLEIMDKIDARIQFPVRLNDLEQGAFSIGYYQQKLKLPRYKKKKDSTENALKKTSE